MIRLRFLSSAERNPLVPRLLAILACLKFCHLRFRFGLLCTISKITEIFACHFGHCISNKHSMISNVGDQKLMMGGGLFGPQSLKFSI